MFISCYSSSCKRTLSLQYAVIFILYAPAIYVWHNSTKERCSVMITTFKFELSYLFKTTGSAHGSCQDSNVIEYRSNRNKHDPKGTCKDPRTCWTT
ncbi:hypothetical protein JHK82_015974 [Glycine max]|uniref:Uncharacterized protein n=1 Tax=Glycine soja TaxID=3848 RepID=A0A0B2Q1E0_GLYSO|nr:hypothetical protein JHK85_016370 [Glycine max]KAG5149093.1 hypothetical protein JHK82_015974 [Glycine max]KHN13758.1 hypothetical protein glysoja_046170 [Glycine soja]